MAKADQFYLAAETIATTIEDQDIADAYVTLCVQAGIAAADVICCARLGEHAQGDGPEARRAGGGSTGQRGPGHRLTGAAQWELALPASARRPELQFREVHQRWPRLNAQGCSCSGWRPGCAGDWMG